MISFHSTNLLYLENSKFQYDATFWHGSRAWWLIMEQRLAVTSWMNIPFKWAAIRFVNTLIKSILCLVVFSAWSLPQELEVFLQPAILLVWRGEGQEKEEERRCIIFEVGAALIAPSQLPPFARRGCRPARRSRVPQCPSTIAHPAHRPSPTLQSLLPAVYRSDPGIIARHPTMHLDHIVHYSKTS